MIQIKLIHTGERTQTHMGTVRTDPAIVCLLGDRANDGIVLDETPFGKVGGCRFANEASETARYIVSA
jgi:hypothetical protein